MKKQTPPLILIVEDNPDNRSLLCQILKKEEYRLSIAGNGQQALEMVPELLPDLILLDIELPVINGIDVCKELQKSPITRPIPIIFLTAYKESQYIVEGLQAGAVDYVTKPFNSPELLARVRTQVELKQSKDWIRHQLADAATYIRSLLPPPMHENPNIQWNFTPSSMLGGDIFHYRWLDTEHFAFYLLDIEGHGLGAALRCVSVMQLMCCSAFENTDFRNPGNVLESINEKRLRNENSNMSASLWYGVYNRTHHTLTYSSAGHPPAVLFNGAAPGESFKIELQSTGEKIGVAAGTRYQNRQVKLESFNRLFLFSNGVYSVKPGGHPAWTLGRWLDVLAEYGNKSSVQLDRLARKVRELTGTDHPDDDFVLLKFEF